MDDEANTCHEFRGGAGEKGGKGGSTVRLFRLLHGVHAEEPPPLNEEGAFVQSK